MRKVYGLIGYPLTHSFSKKYFEEKFLSEGIKDSEYRNFEIKCIEDFPEVFTQLSELLGLNVTIPYKEVVLPYLDEIEKDAQNIGAVNTIKIISKRGTPYLIGYNTDIDGFKSSLLDVWDKKYNKALILGSGGASKAVLYVLQSLGVETTIVSRHNTGDNFLSYAQIDASIIQENLLIINTTPVGMYPNIEAFPDIPYGSITSNHLLFDLIYNPDETEFLKRGKRMGALTMNGYQMLVGQAEKAWSLWNS